MPAASSLFASVGFYSSPFFDALLPIALVFAGITIGGILVAIIISALVGGFHTLGDMISGHRSHRVLARENYDRYGI